MIKKIIIAVGVLVYLYILIFSKNGLLKRMVLNSKTSELTNEIYAINAEIDKSNSLIKKLNTDSRYIEKMAREKYNMIKPNEKYFKVRKKDEISKGAQNGFTH